MSIKERREREKSQRRELILSAASEIITAEGMDNLSIRKIASKIEYSPALIYHYFRDKEDIIEQILESYYKKCLSMVKAVTESSATPEDMLRGFARNYIDMALQKPVEFKTYMLSESPRVLEHSAMLFQGASVKSQALGIMCRGLKDFLPKGSADDRQIELTAQVMWACVFGLITRLIIENDLPEEQKEKLIGHHINIVMAGILPALCRK